MGNRELGRIGEQAAAELLQMEGYEILERNFLLLQSLLLTVFHF